MIQLRKKNNTGFSLVELLVAISVFAIVMTISIGAILNIVDTNKKAQSLKSVMNNLNFALENMTRNIKTGSEYSVSSPNCPAGSISEDGEPQDFASNSLTFRTHDYDGLNSRYSLNGNIIEYQDSGTTYPVTAEEITIELLCFYVTGDESNDRLQPQVNIVVKGYAGVDKTRSAFSLYTTVSKRLLDNNN
jgi:prepilin-type N-terminal cleavage/methylation domain-containing protein